MYGNILIMPLFPNLIKINHTQIKKRMKWEKNLKANNGRFLTEQPIQYPVVPVQPIRPDITFAATLILLPPQQYAHINISINQTNVYMVLPNKSSFQYTSHRISIHFHRYQKIYILDTLFTHYTPPQGLCLAFSIDVCVK